MFKRKGKQEADHALEMVAVKPKSKEQAIAEIHAETLTEQRFNEDSTHESIIVTEMESQFPYGVEDAAMTYANGRADDAISGIHALLAKTPKEELLWFMLFDLYQVSNKRKEFDKLALDYVNECEKSPPMWRSANDESLASVTEMPTIAATEGQLFSLKGSLDLHMADRISLLQAAASKGSIQLDLSGLVLITPEGAGLLQAAMVKLQKQQATLQIASGAFVGLLQQYITQLENNNCEPWLLLLQLYQLQGKETEFEDLAVEFAVRFEVSPPSWESPKKIATSVVEAPKNSVATPNSVIAESQTFIMTGTITSASAAIFDAFKQYAAKHNDVVIDMHAVDRVEFASVGLFMDALMALIPSGKNVSIMGANMMVRVLLITMGLDQMATIAPRK
jgi:anti-anti-sigma regulatory factor